MNIYISHICLVQNITKILGRSVVSPSMLRLVILFGVPYKEILQFRFIVYSSSFNLLLLLYTAALCIIYTYSFNCMQLLFVLRCIRLLFALYTPTLLYCMQLLCIALYFIQLLFLLYATALIIVYSCT
jgi:hypothetical protein